SDNNCEPGQGVEDRSVSVLLGTEAGSGEGVDLKGGSRQTQGGRNRDPGGNASPGAGDYGPQGGPQPQATEYHEDGGTEGGKERGVLEPGRWPRLVLEPEIEVTEKQAGESDGHEEDEQAHSPARQGDASA